MHELIVMISCKTRVWKPDLARYLDFTLDISVRARYLALGPRYLAHRDISARTKISQWARYLGPDQDISVVKISRSGPRYLAWTEISRSKSRYLGRRDISILSEISRWARYLDPNQDISVVKIS